MPLAESTYRSESVGELYRGLDPAELLHDYLIGAALGSVGGQCSIAAGQSAEANRALRAQDAAEQAYLEQMERLGYVPPEDSKIAAPDGAAEEEKNQHRLQNYSTNGKLNLRVVSGALDPNSLRAEKHAGLYYESVRRMNTDVQRIAKNTGFSEREIAEIKQFIFLDKHDLGENGVRRFFPSFETAQSWQRLIDGKHIQTHDLTLLRLEILERQLMLEGKNQAEAHIEASELYNYTKESGEYYDKIKKHSKG